MKRQKLDKIIAESVDISTTLWPCIGCNMLPVRTMYGKAINYECRMCGRSTDGNWGTEPEAKQEWNEDHGKEPV